MSTNPKSASSDAVMQTVAWLRKSNFKAVPIRLQSKAALDEKYVDLNYVPPLDDFWSNRNIGVGVVTGPKHGGPVDIDVDCDEALFFAKRFLPVTNAVFGRASKPDSHFIYKVEEPAFPKKSFMDPTLKEGTTIIEIRADGGHQTVMPGSIHETTGEIIAWSNHIFPEVPTVNGEELYRAVAKVAMAVLVVRHMWMEGQRNEICKHLSGMFFYMDWKPEEAIDFMSAIQDYSGDDDKTRVKTVALTYKRGEGNGKITGASSLRKFLGEDKLVDRLLEWAGSEQNSILQQYNDRYAVVMVEGKFRIAETSGMSQGEPPVLYQKDDFLNLTATDRVTIDGKKVQKSIIWLSNPRRRTYRTLDFVPGQEETGEVLNLWTGWALDPDPDASCTAWLDLLHDVICGGDDDTNTWMMNWFANIIREPRHKSLTAPVLIGPQGAGKSLMFSYFGKVLGSGYITITNEEHIYGRFNRHLAHTLLLHSEEALYGGERKHRGIIKSLITDEYRVLEQKGVDAKRVHNYLRLALTSNEDWAAPAERDDRRFTVINMKKGGKPRMVGPTLLAAVLDEMKGQGPAALFHHFLNVFDYKPRLVRVNIKNEDLSELKKVNLNSIETWWMGQLETGQILPDYLAWAATPKGTSWPEMVSSTALYTHYVISQREQMSRNIQSSAAWATKLNDMLGIRLQRLQRVYQNPKLDDVPQQVKILSDRHNTIVNMPPVNVCRAAFEKYLGHPVEWPELRDDDTPEFMRY